MFTIITDTDATSMPSESDTTSILKELHELTMKLEYAQQEIDIIRLEKLELENEISKLKQQNEELIQENESYLESSEMEQQQISFFRSVSMNVTEVNLHNDDLNIKLSKYEKLIQKLKSKNINLQKEHEKYKIILEQLNEEKQKRDEININNTLNLENKIKDLEHECDQLRDEINTINTMDTAHSLQIPSRPTSAKYKETNDLFRVKNRPFTPLNDTDNINTKPFFSESGNKSNSVQSETEIIINNDEYDMMNQLLQFGYTEHDINTAINTMYHKMDIEHYMDCKCDQYDDEIQAKCAEIEKLKTMNDNNKSIIKALQKKIRLLTQQNNDLVLVKKRNTRNRCTLFNW